MEVTNSDDDKPIGNDKITKSHLIKDVGKDLLGKDLLHFDLESQVHLIPLT